MPPVNWDIFARLPGSAESNFEMLCRALIRRHYGQFGTFAARAAQPGVEFHLNSIQHAHSVNQLDGMAGNADGMLSPQAEPLALLDGTKSRKLYAQQRGNYPT